MCLLCVVIAIWCVLLLGFVCVVIGVWCVWLFGFCVCVVIRVWSVWLIGLVCVVIRVLCGWLLGFVCVCVAIWPLESFNDGGLFNIPIRNNLFFNLSFPAVEHFAFQLIGSDCVCAQYSYLKDYLAFKIVTTPLIPIGQ